jgi:hypothetical protein
MGNGQWAMGNGQWAMGNGQWAMGNGQWAKIWRRKVINKSQGSRAIHHSPFTIHHSCSGN